LVNILIIGGDSKIGSALYKRLVKGTSTVWKTTRRQNLEENEFYFNLEDDINISIFSKIRFDFVFMCASITSLEYCRKNPDESKKINVVNTLKVLSYFNKNGSFVIFFSTNLVFDGTKPAFTFSDQTNPITEYGKQKVLVENELKKLSKTAIFRLTKIIDYDFKLFDSWIIDLNNFKSITPIHNMKMAPVWLGDLVSFVSEFLLRPEKGIFHVSASDEITYYEAAVYIVNKLKLDNFKVEPISYNEIGIQNIPKFTKLSLISSSSFVYKCISSYSAIEDFLNFKHGNNNTINQKLNF
jgi:dTDP-4-dehydrorhamnose reductase